MFGSHSNAPKLHSIGRFRAGARGPASGRQWGLLRAGGWGARNPFCIGSPGRGTGWSPAPFHRFSRCGPGGVTVGAGGFKHRRRQGRCEIQTPALPRIGAVSRSGRRIASAPADGTGVAAFLQGVSLGDLGGAWEGPAARVCEGSPNKRNAQLSLSKWGIWDTVLVRPHLLLGGRIRGIRRLHLRTPAREPGYCCVQADPSARVGTGGRGAPWWRDGRLLHRREPIRRPPEAGPITAGGSNARHSELVFLQKRGHAKGPGAEPHVHRRLAWKWGRRGPTPEWGYFPPDRRSVFSRSPRQRLRG
jgi:hypothetical protein